MNFTLNSIVVTDSDDRMFRVTDLEYTLKIEGFDGKNFYELSNDELTQNEMLVCDENYDNLINIFESVK
jgi:hypothetical protein